MYEPLWFAAGVLAGVVGRSLFLRYIYRPHQETAQDGTARLSCDACEKATFTSADAARKHAIRYHSAIDAGNWQSIISEV